MKDRSTRLAKTMPAPTIGILAGMGPRSTGPFLDLVVTACQEMYGARHDIDFPKMLICSQPAPFYEDRPIDHAALEAATLDGLKHLESAGVDFLAIACNTVHIYYPRLAAAVSVPLLNIVELAVRAVPGSASGVALVAARPTSESGLFQEALRAAGHRVVELDWQSDVDGMLSAVRESTDPDVFRSLWAPIFEKARRAGVGAVLVACLDLSGVVRHADTDLTVVDAADCLARAVVRQWLSVVSSQ
jgi:aspartate racemase